MAEAIPEFGQKREHEERRDGGCGIIFDPAQRAFAVGKRELDGMLMLYGGGVSADEDIQEGVLREVREESGLHDFLRVEKVGSVLTHYRNNVKEVNRVAHATCFLMILQSADTLPLALEDGGELGLARRLQVGQLHAEHVPVPEPHQAVAIRALERAATVSKGHPDEGIRIHQNAPGKSVGVTSSAGNSVFNPLSYVRLSRRLLSVISTSARVNGR